MADHHVPNHADRARAVRRWGREYGGVLAAGALACAVLVGSAALFSRPHLVTWHIADTAAGPGGPASSGAAAAPAPGQPGAVPSATPTRSPARPGAPEPAGSGRATAPAPRQAAPARSATGSARTLLGPRDGRGLAFLLDEYCQRRYGRHVGLVRPWPESGATGNWVCRRRGSANIIIDMTAACGSWYGGAVVASYSDARDQLSWRCYRR